MARHTLVEQRMVAAVGLLALGSGVGIALMLAQKFAVIGLALSLVSVAGVIWIYYSQFLGVYRALRDKRAYVGTNIKELLIIFSILLVVTTLSFSLYFSPPNIENPSIRSRLQFSTISPVKYPDSTTSNFNIEIKNVGTLTATKAITRASGILSDHYFSDSEVNAEMDKLIADIQRFQKVNRHGEIQLGQSVIITIPDGKKDNKAALEVTDNDLSNINSAKSVLYVFVAAEYEDEDKTNEEWRLEYCGYFVTTYVYWHYCPTWPSRVYRLTPSR
jgi:hypothetical protein